MTPLRELAEGIYLLPGPTNLGLLALPGGGALAIDAGLDESAARKLLRALETLGRPLAGVLNTHSHADHVGGNAFLVARTGCRVAAPAAEASLLRAPLWEPLYLFGGAVPPAALRSKFLMAPASPVHLHLEPGPAELFGLNLDLVPLPGHSPGQLGVRVGEVLFAADAFFDPGVLGKHGLPYFAAVEDALRTLDGVGRLGAGLVVPSHGEPGQDPSPALAANRRAIEEGLGQVEALLAGAGPMTGGEVAAAVLNRQGLACRDLGHYHLLRAAVLGYLGCLADRGKVRATVTGENRLLWEARR